MRNQSELSGNAPPEPLGTEGCGLFQRLASRRSMEGVFDLLEDEARDEEGHDQWDPRGTDPRMPRNVPAAGRVLMRHHSQDIARGTQGGVVRTTHPTL